MRAQEAVVVAAALAPTVMTAGLALLARLPSLSTARLWRGFLGVMAAGLLAYGVVALTAPHLAVAPPMLRATPVALATGLLVQCLGLVIGAFSLRYLQGEPHQRRYVAALCGVLAAVNLLLLADHWLVLIVAWAAVGLALQPLLCFYDERPFARLAAHKKRMADRAADLLLIVACTLAWHDVGSGSLSELRTHVATHGMSLALQVAAVLLVLAVILRSALFPVHGWLIQVMEAPTPVSALLHAGVVNLGGLVLIRCSVLLEGSAAASALLVVAGLGTAVLAGMVMLTRISIKVRLAWSTVAQMGFMLLECGLGLYTLAALHLVGHSLYKAHAFLAAADVVRQTRLRSLQMPATVLPASLVLAPCAALLVVHAVHGAFASNGWPAWWTVILALAGAPLLWLPAGRTQRRAASLRLGAGLLTVAGMTAVASLAHALPLGVQDAPAHMLGWVAVTGMACLYLGLVVMQLRPAALQTLRRWSYAGFYVDEAYTRLALTLWPARWTPHAPASSSLRLSELPAPDGLR